MKKIKVGIIGATGYTGEELAKLLVKHPRVEVTYASGKEDRRAKLQDIFPSLKGQVDLTCAALDVNEAIQKTDLVFLSLPHTVSMKVAPAFLKAGKTVIDVSADYRLKEPALYEKFYRVTHNDTANLKKAVYGLPELYRESIRKTKLVANPGCYPTGAILGVLPGVREKLFDLASITVDAKSGTSGAGRKAAEKLEAEGSKESFKAFKLFEHQHVPEMDQVLSEAAGQAVSVVFVPHLLPIRRGILSTIYVKLAKPVTQEALTAIYKKYYQKEPFVRIHSNGSLPELKEVAHSNFCSIGLRVDPAKRLAVIVTAIDNLDKGAAGQAVQNMNILCGFDEKEGLGK